MTAPEQREHRWIRTIPTDGKWCELCGHSEAQWTGDDCSGEGAARFVEAKMAALVASLRAEVAATPGVIARKLQDSIVGDPVLMKLWLNDATFSAAIKLALKVIRGVS